MKRAVLVVGPESSGTRLVTEVLVRAGCAGESVHFQAFDTEPLDGDPVVWRRSYPHNGQWPCLATMVERCRAEGYAPQVVVTVRDMWCTAHSAANVRHNNVESWSEAMEYGRRALLLIFEQLRAVDVPWVLMPYEALLNAPIGARKALLRMLKLPCGSGTVELTNQNEKHYNLLFVGGVG